MFAVRTWSYLTVFSLTAGLLASAAHAAAPAAPAGIAAADVTKDDGTQLRVTITKSPDDTAGGVTKYVVWRRTAATPNVQVKEVAATGAATYQFVDPGLTPGAAYNYSTRAYKGALASGAVSTWGRPVNDADITPRIPTNVRVTDVPADLGTALLVRWLKSPDDPVYVSKYYLYRKTDATSWVQLATVLANDLAEYTYTDSPVAPNLVYRYGVRAVAGGGRTSDLVSAAGQAWDNTARKPNPARSPSVADFPADDGTSLLVRWQASLDDPGIVSGYTLYRRPGAIGAWVQLTSVYATGAASYEYKDSGLTPGALYQYGIRSTAGWTVGDLVTAQGRPRNNGAIVVGPAVNLRVEDVPSDLGTALAVKWAPSPQDPAYVTRYDVYKRTGADPWALLTQVSAEGSALYTLTDTPLTVGTLYYYSVRAIAGPYMSPLVSASGTPYDNTPRPPADPTNLGAVDVPADDGTQLDIKWTKSVDDPAIVTKYTLYRWNGSTWLAVMDVPIAKATGQYIRRIGGLTPGVLYRYGIRAFAGLMASALVKMDVGVRPINNTAPTPLLPPASITVTDTGTGDALNIAFAKSPHDPVYVTRYDVYRRVGSGSWSLYKQVAADDKASYSFPETGLTGGTTYYYGVRSIAGAKQSDMIIGSGSPKDLFPPGPPTLAGADVPGDNGNAIALTVGKSADDGAGRNDVKSYKLERRVAGTATYSPLTTIAANASATHNYTDGTCTPGATYDYRATAFDGTNYSTAATAIVTAEDNLAPQPPASVAVSDVPADDGDALNIIVRKSPDDGAGAKDVRAYEVWCAAPGQALGLVNTIIATGAASYSWNHTGLTPGLLYSYAVRALDQGRASSSVVGNGTPVDNTAPRAPTSLVAVDKASDATGAVTITFNASPDDTPTDREVTSYELWMKLDGGTWAITTPATAATGAAVYTFAKSGLTLNQKYWFRVRAIAPTGNSGYSNEDDATPIDDTQSAPPAAIDAYDRPYDDGGVILIAVSKSPDDGAGRNIVRKYRIYRKRAAVVENPALLTEITATGAATYTHENSGLSGFILYEYTATAVTAAGVESAAAGPDRAVAENNNSLVVDWNPPGALVAADRAGDSGGVIQVQWNRTTAEDNTGPPPPPPLSPAVVDTTGDGHGTYEFHRRVVGAAWPTGIPSFSVSDSGTGSPMLYLDRNLTNGTNYEYRCRYRRSNRVSGWSNTAGASPKDG